MTNDAEVTMNAKITTGSNYAKIPNNTNFTNGQNLCLHSHEILQLNLPNMLKLITAWTYQPKTTTEFAQLPIQKFQWCWNYQRCSTKPNSQHCCQLRTEIANQLQIVAKDATSFMLKLQQPSFTTRQKSEITSNVHRQCLISTYNSVLRIISRISQTTKKTANSTTRHIQWINVNYGKEIWPGLPEILVSATVKIRSACRSLRYARPQGKF